MRGNFFPQQMPVHLLAGFVMASGFCLATAAQPSGVTEIAHANGIHFAGQPNSNGFNTDADSSMATTRIERAAELNKIGIASYRAAKYDAALRSFEAAAGLYVQFTDAKGEATALGEIAMCYNVLGQKQRAAEYLKKALPKWQQLGDHEREATTVGEQADVYRTWGFPDLSLRYYKRAIRLFQPIGDDAGRAAVLNNTGLAYFDLRNSKKALEYFNAALEAYRSVDDVRDQALVLVNIGSAFNQAHKSVRALEVLERARTLATIVGDKKLVAESLARLSKVYASSGKNASNTYLPDNRETVNGSGSEPDGKIAFAPVF